MPATVSRKDFLKDCLLGWGGLITGLGAGLAGLRRAVWEGLQCAQPQPRVAPPRDSVKRHV